MKRIKTIPNFEKLILMIMGFVGTAPILQIKGVTLFTFCIFIVVAFIGVQTVKKDQITLNKESIFYFLILISSCITAVVCINSDIPIFWKDVQMKNLVWVLLFLIIFVIYASEKKYTMVNYYLKGVYIAAIVQMFWGFFQFVVYRINGKLINDIVFIDWLGMVEQASQVKDGGITLTGLCWNAGNVAPLIIFGYAFTNKFYLKCLFVAFSFISGGRTLLIGCAICIFVDILYSYKKIGSFIKKNKAILTSVAIIGCASILIFNRDIITSIFEKITSLLESFTVLQTQSSARVHIRYWTSVPYITGKNPIMTNLFGFGLNCSGYAQVLYFNQYADSKYAWVLECDYVNILWNTGYVGFALHYIWIIKNVIKSIRIDRRYVVFFAGILVAGITYNVMFNWCWLAIVFCFILITKKEKVNLHLK